MSGPIIRSFYLSIMRDNRIDTLIVIIIADELALCLKSKLFNHKCCIKDCKTSTGTVANFRLSSMALINSHLAQCN